MLTLQAIQCNAHHLSQDSICVPFRIVRVCIFWEIYFSMQTKPQKSENKCYMHNVSHLPIEFLAKIVLEVTLQIIVLQYKFWGRPLIFPANADAQKITGLPFPLYLISYWYGAGAEGTEKEKELCYYYNISSIW